MRYRLAILDLEGTLVPAADESLAIALEDLGASCGLAIAIDDVRHRAGMNGGKIVRECLERTLGRPPSPGVVAHLTAELGRAMLDRAVNYSGLRGAGGVVDVLTALGVTGVSVAVVSGFDRRTVDALLDRMGWRSAVNHSVCADDVSDGRPSPAMIHALMARADVRDAAEVAMLGDSPHDLAAGIAAGCGLVACVPHAPHAAVVATLPGVRMLENVAALTAAMSGIDRGPAGTVDAGGSRLGGRGAR